jgi:hypothetical protein
MRVMPPTSSTSLTSVGLMAASFRHFLHPMRGTLWEGLLLLRVRHGCEK